MSRTRGQISLELELQEAVSTPNVSEFGPALIYSQLHQQVREIKSHPYFIDKAMKSDTDSDS